LRLTDLITVVIFWTIVLHRWRRQCVPRLPRIPRVAPDQLRSPPLVSIIVPARNEGDCIERCIRSLLVQDYPHFEVIAVNDNSQDDTGPILDRLAAVDRRLTVIHGAPLPSGWMGKAHAIVQGYQVARGDWLLFTDADTAHAPWLLSGVMTLLRDSPAAFATVLGRQQHPSFGIYLANLAVFSYIFLVTDRRSFQEPRSRQSLVNGQYVIVARQAYEAIGTHAAVRQYSGTDVSLGYLAKLQRWMPLLIDGRDSLVTTMYRSLAEAFHGWSRSLVNGSWSALGRGLGSTALLAAMAVLWFLWVRPWAVVLRGLVGGDHVALALGGLQLLAGMTVLRLRSGQWWSAAGAIIAMPASCLLFLAIGGVGRMRGWWRGGSVWKGRVVYTAQRLPPWQPPPHVRRVRHDEPEGSRTSPEDLSRS
jgi:chlorobactene glucosyltransferase